MVTPIIEVRHLHNQFGSQVVHHNLDLDVMPGEILSVVGGSGTGKSVLLRSIVGLNQPQDGRILVAEQELARLPPTQRTQLEQQMGVLFQQGALFSSLTVAENIALPLIEHRGLSQQQARRVALMKLGLVGLPAHAADKYPNNLSGGMIKRAALGRALALDPNILFLDEPTAGLDPISAAEFDQLILTLRNALGLTVFLVTHDLDTIYTISDRIAVISQQRVLINDKIQVVSSTPDDWVQAYFHGPRGRAAQNAQPKHSQNLGEAT